MQYLSRRLPLRITVSQLVSKVLTFSVLFMCSDTSLSQACIPLQFGNPFSYELNTKSTKFNFKKMAWTVFTYGSTRILLKSEKPKPFHWLQGSLVTFPMWVSEAGKPISRWSKTKSSSRHIIHCYSSSSSKANALQYYQPNCTNGEAQENIQPKAIQPAWQS